MNIVLVCVFTEFLVYSVIRWIQTESGDGSLGEFRLHNLGSSIVYGFDKVGCQPFCLLFCRVQPISG